LLVAVSEIVQYIDAMGVSMAKIQDAWARGDENHSNALRVQRDQNAEHFREQLAADGWTRERGAWLRWTHVDDLEKIEGPPPEGAF
jgi:hypothetical protein